jgi:zinc transport system substrate-binding protein
MKPRRLWRWVWVPVMVGLLGVMFLPGCGAMPDPWEGQPEPHVLVSFPPLYSFTKKVTGDQAGVLCLCKTVGPHGYRYQDTDTFALRRADLFLVNGLGLDDHFTDRMNQSSKNNHLHYVKLGDTLPDGLRKKGEAHEHEDGTVHHGEHDPHVWLGIPQAVFMVDQIRQELTRVAPQKGDTYRKNADEYTAALKKLHEEGKEKLKGLKEVPVVTFHESLAYFADSFGLKVVGSLRPVAMAEASPRDLEKIVEKCKNHDQVIVTWEPQYPRSTAEHLTDALKKVGVKDVFLVSIDPLETCAQESDLTPDWYVKKMWENIDNLAKCVK